MLSLLSLLSTITRIEPMMIIVLPGWHELRVLGAVSICLVSSTLSSSHLILTVRIFSHRVDVARSAEDVIITLRRSGVWITLRRSKKYIYIISLPAAQGTVHLHVLWIVRLGAVALFRPLCAAGHRVPASAHSTRPSASRPHHLPQFSCSTLRVQVRAVGTHVFTGVVLSFFRPKQTELMQRVHNLERIKQER